MVNLPKEVREEVKAEIFKRADEYDYSKRSRSDNGRFMDTLVDDSKIGKRLQEHMEPAKVRTYIKDGVLHQYTTEQRNRAFVSQCPKDLIKKHYNVETSVLSEQDGIIVCATPESEIFVISRGTVLKWETAVRKALDFITKNNRLIIRDEKPAIILQLVTTKADMTGADYKQIESALNMIDIKVSFSDA